MGVFLCDVALTLAQAGSRPQGAGCVRGVSRIGEERDKQTSARYVVGVRSAKEQFGDMTADPFQ